MLLAPTSVQGTAICISSSGEFNENMFKETFVNRGALAVSSTDNANLCGDDQHATLTDDNNFQLVISSISPTAKDEHDSRIETKRAAIRNKMITNNNNNRGFFRRFFGCFKPFFSAIHTFGNNFKHNKYTISTIIKSNDGWEIPVSNITNDLELIGGGIEGSVFRSKLNGQDVACKRVRTLEETNIKYLKKLNHINVIKFRGISIATPSFYIVMEYCAYGSLYDVLKRHRELNSRSKPTQVLDWSRQISNGVDYLHGNKIVHRDLKSPNILFFDEKILKISDFGTSKELVDRHSQIMSFNGTSAWMAPEVIRKELCSEKIDVWSFGIILWEILTCAVPYNNIDPIAVMWGVAKGTLKLPIPSSVPESFQLLMKTCWEQCPSDRPSFKQIIKSLDISKPEIVLFEQEQEYAEITRIWSGEVHENLSKLPTVDIFSALAMNYDELMKQRKEEIQLISNMRAHYQKRVQQINTLYTELKSLMIQLEERERVINERECFRRIDEKTGNTNPIFKARKNSSKLKRVAATNVDHFMTSISHRKRREYKRNDERSRNQGFSNSDYKLSKLNNNLTLSSSSKATNKKDSTHTKNIRYGEKKSDLCNQSSSRDVASCTLPNLSAIRDVAKRHVPINTKLDCSEKIFTTDPKISCSSAIITSSMISSPSPSISAAIDSNLNTNTCELYPRNVDTDVKRSLHESISSLNCQHSSTTLPIRSCKSSNDTRKNNNTFQYYNFPRRHRRPYLNQHNRKARCSSLIVPRSLKFNPLSHQGKLRTNKIYIEDSTDDIREQRENSKIDLSCRIVNDREIQRKVFTSAKDTSEEEEEENSREEILKDINILNDHERRAKNYHSNDYSSSENEILGAKAKRPSLKNNDVPSDEGGHISDDQSESNDFLFYSEPESEKLNKQ